DCDRVRLRAQDVHEAAGVLAGDPARARDAHPAVEADRNLVRDERPARRHEGPPLLDLLPAAEAELAVGELGADPSLPKMFEPAPVRGMRIELAGDDSRDPGLEQRLDARRRRSAVCAGLERDVDRGAASSLAGCLECDDLGMRAALLLVPALADDLVAG